MATQPEYLVELIDVSERLLAYIKDRINEIKQDSSISDHVGEVELARLKGEAYDLSERIEELKQLRRKVPVRVPLSTDTSTSSLLKRPRSSELPDVARRYRKRPSPTLASRDPKANSSKQKAQNTFATSEDGNIPTSALITQAILQDQHSTIQSHQPTVHWPPIFGSRDTASGTLTDRFFEISDAPRLPHGPSNLSAGYENVINREANLVKQMHPQSPSLPLRPSPTVERHRPALPDARLSMIPSSPTGPWMHSSVVGCIVFNRDTGEYFKICCYRCGFNALERDGRVNFVSGMQGMRAHWSAARQCQGRGLNVDAMLASATVEALTEQQAVQLVLHADSIQKDRGDKSLPDIGEELSNLAEIK